MLAEMGYQIQDLTETLTTALGRYLTQRIAQARGGDSVVATGQVGSAATAAVILLTASLKMKDVEDQRLALRAAEYAVENKTIAVTPTATGFSLRIGDITVNQDELARFLSSEEVRAFCVWRATEYQHTPNWLLIEGTVEDWLRTLDSMCSQTASGLVDVKFLDSESILAEATTALATKLPVMLGADGLALPEAKLVAAIAIFAAIIRTSDSTRVKQAAANACTQLIGSGRLSFGFHSGGFNLKCRDSIVTVQTLAHTLAPDARRAIIEFGANVGGLRNRYRIPTGIDFGQVSDNWERLLRSLDH